MNTGLLQGMIDIVFKGNLLYLSPMLFLLMVVLFADKLIELVVSSISLKTGRRNSY